MVYVCLWQETIEEYKSAMGYGECEAHWCFDPETQLCKMSLEDPVLAGTECSDTTSWCIEGQCVPNSLVITGNNRPTCDCKLHLQTIMYPLPVGSKPNEFSVMEFLITD